MDRPKKRRSAWIMLRNMSDKLVGFVGSLLVSLVHRAWKKRVRSFMNISVNGYRALDAAHSYNFCHQAISATTKESEKERNNFYFHPNKIPACLIMFVKRRPRCVRQTAGPQNRAQCHDEETHEKCIIFLWCAASVLQSQSGGVTFILFLFLSRLSHTRLFKKFWKRHL